MGTYLTYWRVVLSCIHHIIISLITQQWSLYLSLQISLSLINRYSTCILINRYSTMMHDHFACVTFQLRSFNYEISLSNWYSTIMPDHLVCVTFQLRSSNEMILVLHFAANSLIYRYSRIHTGPYPTLNWICWARLMI